MFGWIMLSLVHAMGCWALTPMLLNAVHTDMRHGPSHEPTDVCTALPMITACTRCLWFKQTAGVRAGPGTVFEWGLVCAPLSAHQTFQPPGLCSLWLPHPCTLPSCGCDENNHRLTTEVSGLHSGIDASHAPPDIAPMEGSMWKCGITCLHLPSM